MKTYPLILITCFLVLACEGPQGSGELPTPTNGSHSDFQTEPVVDDPVVTPIEAPGPVPAWYKLSKGSESDSEQKIIEICSALGERSRVFHLDRLIVAFEGLASFSQSQTQELYQAYENDPELLEVEVPGKKGSGGFMVNYLLWPVLKQSQGTAEFVVFPQTAIGEGQTNSQPELCARAWLQAHPQGRLVITGHSYGGHAANQLADRLEMLEVEIETVITVDPRTKGYKGSLGKTSNAKEWINFYQKNTPFLNGYIVEEAENINLSSTGVSHGDMPGRIEIKRALLESLKNSSR